MQIYRIFWPTIEHTNWHPKLLSIDISKKLQMKSSCRVFEHLRLPSCKNQTSKMHWLWILMRNFNFQQCSVYSQTSPRVSLLDCEQLTCVVRMRRYKLTKYLTNKLFMLKNSVIKIFIFFKIRKPVWGGPFAENKNLQLSYRSCDMLHCITHIHTTHHKC